MKKFICFLFGFFTILFLMLSSILFFANNRSFYNKQYIKNNTTAATGVSLEDLNEITDNLLCYLNGSRDSLDMQFLKNDKLVEIFDEREKMHMVDVKKLYKYGVNFTFFNLFASIACFIVAIRLNKPNLSKPIINGYKLSSIIFAFIALAFGGLFTFAFDWFWINFHHIFFTNDLWILDPNISTMINMFPIEFFFSICVNILILFVTLTISFGFILKLILKKVNNYN